ncbi:hypothetical protein CSUB8523_0858 [Campylobacter subantarcticus LMG 24377]|uniref:Uncharacterized protein n=2 Tax=Campylobacter subantarcticus TaxID=497724 RepID=A0A0A8HAC0_9BACT|nr:hypothetical protein [Campylobacter subantarcticus]EAJ1260694.1 hypothetical protein [Campylobacter lari]AJC90620.1 hypothetical protein CSUB8521_0771 [Campylobacter subantarcticus LMG 24374]AJC92380.1 hypothetical protein CSUB8523_0858 [Campylobacter subantarcticus LMG 24377]EAL3938603.1 hypothetical protein [Campylobacter lari]MPB99561.1 hypothetical protein [Campylobacter subantarcticus]
MSEVKDEFELALEVKKNELVTCQNVKNLKSCLPCSMIFECALRKEYIDAVYKSMSKGKEGGFDF